ncbi:hypothetical protein DYB28_000531 [Aphanomyces astaci]|uniref:Uncharacterized protein n=1 Tax=Aphanomyces astaci TaxID=112090 RepID=A0A397B6K1_APHAT|nr:hypothetical protein DYB36_004608 [Aphanomyces astaci]RHY23694.1 hypothetical protein DYB25_003747 [Aphanomyces astaci]RHY36514.1 hypothetical protein DYB38_002800 [Aphanomyces astaci]RHY44597.1 hypothetical protein DYB30_004786 [Aphanomyces astaci]RHY62794.1 hypothetical protein DYB34_001879 [Aphanomyces astaci]
MKDTSSAGNVVVDLATARENYLAEQEKDSPNVSVKFRYAQALTRDEKAENKTRGIGLLLGIINKVECLFTLSTTYFELGDHAKCRQYCERLLRIDPTNEKALNLHRCVKDTLTKDSAIGIGLAAGAVVALGIVLKFLLKNKN